MNNELQYFMDLNYQTIFKKKDAAYYFFIPELNIIAEGEDILNAYNNMLLEKEKFFKRMIEMGMHDNIKEPSIVKIRKEFARGLLVFTSKTTIFFIIFIIFSYFIFLPILSSLNKFITNKLMVIPSQSISKVVEKIDTKLSNMTEQENEVALLKVRNLAHKVKPYTDEIKILFQSPEKTGNKEEQKK